jgi:antirestriction protein ArdC
MKMPRNLYHEVTARILAELENGAAPWIKPWSGYSGPQHPHNAATGRPYSGCNVVLLWMAQQTDSRFEKPKFLTFKQAQELGGNVCKGEKGTKVYFVSTFEKQEAGDNGESNLRRIPFLKEYTVFNVAQCENLPAKIDEKPISKNPDERAELADQFMAATLADIRHGESRAYYQSAGDFVMLPAFEAFKSACSYYATAFHELGHWSGHERRVNRQLRNRFGSNEYAAEELVAELCAAFLCAEFQFDGEIRHAGYIQSWIKLLKSDDRAFFTAASAAQKAADYLRGLAIAEPLALAA